MDEGEGKREFPKLYSVFPEHTLVLSRSQAASRSPLGLCAGGYLKIASDLADVVCIEAARHRPNMWHPHRLPLLWSVCVDWVKHVEQATGCRICFFWPQLSKSWLSQAKLMMWSFSTISREQHAPPEDNCSQIP